MKSSGDSGIDIYWLPVGAGGHSVRLNGRVFESLAARPAHHRPLDLYHAALEVHLDGARYTIEMTPIPDGNGAARGVVGEGPVGSRLLRRLRWFRYELRCWRDGIIADVAEAVASPQRISDGGIAAKRLLELVPHIPKAVWGSRRASWRRDVELELGCRLAARPRRRRCRPRSSAERRSRVRVERRHRRRGGTRRADDDARRRSLLVAPAR
jgi:hypothetical protein